jgi:hypothetical protein
MKPTEPEPVKVVAALEGPDAREGGMVNRFGLRGWLKMDDLAGARHP